MCGRYALSLRPSVVRHRLAEQNMPAEDAPSDDDQQLRQTYNFAPSNHGLIYRADTSDRGTDATPLDQQQNNDDNDGEPSPKKVKLSSPSKTSNVDGLATRETKYKLQSAKWGLIPFWTKRPPDYGSTMRTINCRDDSLAQSGGMWNTMKQRKRCIVVAEGFYEWLKKNNGKEKLPHFVKRKDGGLMCFAGLWDCVQYESVDGEAEGEKLYTYTVITTDSNKQLKFLHDRMPVILEPGSEEMRTWLDPGLNGWNRELQAMLKPFEGELECYQVDKAVGKVGNNSPSFVVPIDSKENKKNIANFFGKQASPAKKAAAEQGNGEVEKEEGEDRETTVKTEDSESNAPLPKPPGKSEDELSQAIKRDTSDLSDSAMARAADESTEKGIKKEEDGLDDEDLLEAEKSPPRKVWMSPSKPRFKAIDESVMTGMKRDRDEDDLDDEDLLEAEKSPPRKVWNSPSKPKAVAPSPVKGASASPAKPSETSGKTRSAISNGTQPKTPTKGANKKITAFFGGK